MRGTSPLTAPKSYLKVKNMFVNTWWNIELNHRWLASPNQRAGRPDHNINIRKCHGQQTAALKLDTLAAIFQGTTHLTHHTYMFEASCQINGKSNHRCAGLQTQGTPQLRQHPTHTATRREKHAAAVSLADSMVHPASAHAVPVHSQTTRPPAAHCQTAPAPVLPQDSTAHRTVH